MKNLLLSSIMGLILLSCAACVHHQLNIVDFKPGDVSSVDMYDIHGSASKRKQVTAEADIKTIMDTLSAVKIKGGGADAEPTNGGAIQFVFNQSDGCQWTVSCDGSTILSENDFWYAVDDSLSLFALWDQMKYDAQDIPEYELPLYPKDQLPYLGLQFMMDGDLCNTNASVGTYSWSYENEDGTMSGVEACSVPSLDAGAELAPIKKTEDMKEIVLKFSMPPDSYSVVRWPEAYIGDAEAHGRDYEPVDAVDYTVPLSDDGGYVYEVYARWPMGRAYYWFYVK